MSNEELMEIKERAERATPGPLIFTEGDANSGEQGRFVTAITQEVVCDFGYVSEWEASSGSAPSLQDISLFENAREDILKLVGEVERLREQHDRLLAFVRMIIQSAWDKGDPMWAVKLDDELKTVIDGKG